MKTVSEAFDYITYSRNNLLHRVPEISLCSAQDDTLNIDSFKFCVSKFCGEDTLVCGDEAFWLLRDYECRKCDLVCAETTEGFDNDVPFGSTIKSVMDITLNNTDGKYNIVQADGIRDTSVNYQKQGVELNENWLPGTPAKLNIGWKIPKLKMSETITSFCGYLEKLMDTNTENGLNSTANAHFIDWVAYFERCEIKEDIFIQNASTDYIIKILLQQCGLQGTYAELEQGENIVGTFIAKKGTFVGDYLNELVQAEMGIFKLNSDCRFELWNRCHWASAPVVANLNTHCTSDDYGEMIMDISDPDNNEVINIIEVEYYETDIEPDVEILNLTDVETIPANKTLARCYEYDDPAINVDALTNSSFTTNGGAGAVTIDRIEENGTNICITWKNNTNASVDVTSFVVTGDRIYLTEQDSCTLRDEVSIARHGEYYKKIDNQYVGSKERACTIAQENIKRYADPFSTYRLNLTIKCIPNLELGDVVNIVRRIKNSPPLDDDSNSCYDEVMVCDKYIVKEINTSICEGGCIQNIQVTNFGVDLGEFTFCESSFCGLDAFCGQEDPCGDSAGQLANGGASVL